MNREIKFRAWGKENKQFYPHDSLTFAMGRMSESAEEKGYILLQYTGLKDKNGVEIYEGDLVALACSGDGATKRHNIFGEVKWSEDRFVVAIPDKTVKVIGGESEGKMLSWREIHSWTGMHTCLTGWESTREVIGNIYSNPELIK